MTHFAQIGNFEPPHSTENELRKATAANGHTVETFQENTTGVFVELARRIGEFDIVLWTRTGWDPPVPKAEQARMLEAADKAGVPTVGFHLDRWFGLNRQGQVKREPFFAVDRLFTADGGHDVEYDAAGVNHTWMPPAVSEFEMEPGTPRDEFVSDVAFVGSWLPGYHVEWKHRPRLVRFLQREYGCESGKGLWPRKGEPAVRCGDLRDLYASTKVNVGDSCLSGGATRYWSDRIPETLGRGGFLLHPWVEGIDDHFTVGEHLVCWELNNWDQLRGYIDAFLADDEARARVAAAGKAHVAEHHTYTVRIRQILEAVL